MNVTGEAKVRRYAHESRRSSKASHRLEGSKYRAERWAPGGFRKGGVPKRFRARSFFPEVNKVYWSVENGRSQSSSPRRSSRRSRESRAAQGRWQYRAQREVRPSRGKGRKLAVEAGSSWGYQRVSEVPAPGRRRSPGVSRTGWRLRVAKRIV